MAEKGWEKTSPVLFRSERTAKRGLGGKETEFAEAKKQAKDCREDGTRVCSFSEAKSTRLIGAPVANCHSGL